MAKDKQRMQSLRKSLDTALEKVKKSVKKKKLDAKFPDLFGPQAVNDKTIGKYLQNVMDTVSKQTYDEFNKILEEFNVAQVLNELDEAVIESKKKGEHKAEEMPRRVHSADDVIIAQASARLNGKRNALEAAENLLAEEKEAVNDLEEQVAAKKQKLLQLQKQLKTPSKMELAVGIVENGISTSYDDIQKWLEGSWTPEGTTERRSAKKGKK
eukprot:m.116190 g.116190  ORF g.116190 m.116190 type:complete len:212 (-) comp14226_c0_seq2:2703-3338(-)